MARAGGASRPHVPFVDEVTQFCLQSLLADPDCCRDVLRRPGVSPRDISRPGTAWRCRSPETGGECLDDQVGPRGDDRLWSPVGADCSTPRLLFVHGGDWRRFGPTSGAYDALASKLAFEGGAVVLVPDFRLAPVGNYTDTLRGLEGAWRWLADHGGDAEDCSAAPLPPLFMAGDGSGAASALSLLLRATAPGTRLPAPAGFVGLSPWTNLASNTPTYFTNAFAAIGQTDRQGALAVVGDIFNRLPPGKNALSMRLRALEYVSQDEMLLTYGMASPFYALPEQLAALPPLYFAIAGSEARSGDGIILASRAAKEGVLVVQDIFDIAWHGFPLYSEGCGTGAELWQGVAALRRSGEFMRHVSASEGLRQRGSGLYASIYYSPSDMYSDTYGREPWTPAARAAQPRSRAAPQPPSPAPPACEAGGCAVTTLAAAYLTGAAGGGICTALAVLTIWVQGSQRGSVPCGRRRGEAAVAPAGPPEPDGPAQGFCGRVPSFGDPPSFGAPSFGAPSFGAPGAQERASSMFAAVFPRGNEVGTWMSLPGEETEPHPRAGRL